MKKYCVISHTHWDREWYLPLENMRLKLCDLLDHCLTILAEQPEYIFHLDAQTVVLEDYLEFHPSRREELKKYIAEGRLIVGPWYLQNDFYLTSGEATVRNLIEGQRLGEEFGGCADVGYIPDQFGNPDQLPQVLKQFGIDSVIFGRGYPEKNEQGSVMPSEFQWEGADGTRILTVIMKCWYNNAQHFAPEAEKAKILLDLNKGYFEGVATTPYLLLMNGVDHLEPQPDLLPVLEEVRKLLPEDEDVRQMTMAEYMNLVRQYTADKEMTVARGEMRHGYGVDLLKSTLSSRFYLKAANVRTQTMLENRLEPLYVMLELAGMHGAYSHDIFRYMWKALMRNHPHDSICGCSRDEVHAHMEDNYARLETTTKDIWTRGMKLAAEHLDLPGDPNEGYVLAVANTTQRVQDRVVEVAIDVRKSEGFAGFSIVDAQGNPADYVVLSHQEVVRDGFSPLNLPGNFPVDRWQISLRTGPVQPFAVKGFIVRGTETPNAAEPACTCAADTLENERYRLTVDADGRVCLLDKTDGRRFDDLIDWEDTADRGDSYTYCSEDNGTAIYGHDFPAKVEKRRCDRMGGEICIVRELLLPKGYDFEANKRTEETAVTRVELRLKLTAGTTPPELFTRVDNASCDHRLRLKINTGIAVEETVADNMFDIVTRADADHQKDLWGIVLPNATFAALEKDGKGLAVLTEGAHEYGRTEDKQALFFTVVRSTGIINRNFSTMESGGGEQWVCPENQCLRTVEGRFALLPYTGEAAQCVPQESVVFRAGLSVYYTSRDTRKFLQGRPAVQDSRLQEFYFLPDPYADVKIPDNRSLLTVDGASVLVTAVKQTEDQQGFAVRAVNLSQRSATLTVEAPKTLYLSDAKETKGDVTDGKVALRAKEIRTLRF